MKAREQQLKVCSSVSQRSADLPAVRNIKSTKTQDPHVSNRALALLSQCAQMCA
jgi:hypothetical protein